jgi:uncharacterized protein YqeY
MSLKERLQEDWKQALKAKDKFRADTISTARAAVLHVEKTDGVKIDDEQVIEILSREVKQRREAVLEFEKGNRQDLVDKSNSEIEILLGYLPQQLTEEEILVMIQEAAVEVGANSIKEMGRVMQVLAPRVKGRADGKLVSQMVREHLNK